MLSEHDRLLFIAIKKLLLNYGEGITLTGPEAAALCNELPMPLKLAAREANTDDSFDTHK